VAMRVVDGLLGKSLRGEAEELGISFVANQRFGEGYRGFLQLFLPAWRTRVASRGLQDLNHSDLQV
jgi:hypothetical protein